MTPEEVDKLHAVIQTLSDPRGNWEYGWKMLCELAGVDPDKHVPPFKQQPLLTDAKKP